MTIVLKLCVPRTVMSCRPSGRLGSIAPELLNAPERSAVKPYITVPSTATSIGSLGRYPLPMTFIEPPGAIAYEPNCSVGYIGAMFVAVAVDAPLVTPIPVIVSGPAGAKGIAVACKILPLASAAPVANVVVPVEKFTFSPEPNPLPKIVSGEPPTPQ